MAEIWDILINIFNHSFNIVIIIKATIPACQLLSVVSNHLIFHMNGTSKKGIRKRTRQTSLKRVL